VWLEVEALEKRFGVGLIPAGIDGLDQAHVPGEGGRAVEPHVFGDKADVSLGGDLVLGQGMAEHPDAAVVLMDEAEENADGG
jgi:hypothetical protein